MTCEMCGDEPSVGVASIPGIPMSIAWGKKCLDSNGIPYWAAVANTAMVGNYDESAEWWQQIVDDTLTYFGKTREQFDIDVAKELAEFDAMMAADMAAFSDE